MRAAAAGILLSPRVRGFAIAACAVCLTVAARVAEAQVQAPVQRCVLEFEGGATRSNAVRLPSDNYNFFQGGGVTYRCKGQDVTLIADSAEYYGDANVLVLITNVHYREPRVRVDSRRMTYWRMEERLLAEGDVYAQLPSGTTMRGPQAEYFRPVPGIRAQSRMVATGRPQMQLVERTASGAPGEPVNVVANQLVTLADSVVYATGAVEITRPDITARADSAMLDKGAEFARLMRSPVIEGKQERPFTLRGNVIDVFSRQKRLERVLAYDRAHATSADLDLASDTVDIRVERDRMQRAYAWGPSRARVTSLDRNITADSIEVVMPDQRIQEMRAVRKAFAETLPDTTKLRSSERDWLRGDTIVATFDTLTRADSTRKPRIRTLVARGSASSFYQIPAETPTARPSLNYVRGSAITVRFDAQQVQSVTVLEKAVGMYLEPAPDTAGTSGAAPQPATQPVGRPGVSRP